MNRWKWFGSRPVLFFAEGDGGGAGAGGGAAAGGAGGGTGGGGGAADTSSLSDAEFLANTPAETTDTGSAIVKTEAAAAETTGEEALIKPGALEDGEPEWFASVKDAEHAKQARELWTANQEYQKHFKTPAEMAEFFKDLPGGRDQVAALQTLSKEVTELDSAIEANTPEGNTQVVERYLSMAPDKGLGLVRASAHHLAKANPEGWQQLSTELVNATLKSAGIGADLAVVSQAIKEMRDAATAQDGEAFGRAAQKLLGAPPAERQEDPNVVRARTEAANAASERDKALAITWENSVNTNVAAVETMLRQDIGVALSKVLMESTKESTRKELADKIIKEVDGQTGANAWLRSQIQQLVGSHQQKNLRAAKEDFDKALQLSKDAAKPLVIAAVRKVVTAWAKELAATNQAARDKAKGGAARVDVGGTARAAAAGAGVITEEMVRDQNLSDEELLNRFSRR